MELGGGRSHFTLRLGQLGLFVTETSRPLTCETDKLGDISAAPSNVGTHNRSPSHDSMERICERCPGSQLQ